MFHQVLRHQMTGLAVDTEMFEFSTQHFEDDSYRVDTRGLSYIYPSRWERYTPCMLFLMDQNPLVDIKGDPFLDHVA